MSDPRVVDARRIASVEDVAEGDLVRWEGADGSTWVARVASVAPAADGLGVDLTFAAEDAAE